MIAMLVKGRSFRSLLGYTLRERFPARAGEARIIGGNMAGRTPGELAAEFGLVRRLRPQLSRAVFHASLSAAPTDRVLSDAEFSAIAEVFMRELGFAEAEAPFVVIRHTESEKREHIHICGSRVGTNGNTVSEAQDFRRAETILREIEQAYGLTPVASSNAALPQKRKQQRRTTMDEKTKKAIVERLEGASRDAEAQIYEMLGQDVASVVCAETLSEREARTQKRFAVSTQMEHSLHQILGNDIKHIHRTPRGLVLYTKDGGRIHHDNASSKLVCYRTDPKVAAHRLISISTLLGWKAIKLNGSAAFVEEAMKLAVANGLKVVPVDAFQQTLLLTILGKSSGGGLTLAPQPTQSATPLPDFTHTLLPPPIPAPPAPAPSAFGDEIAKKLAKRREEQEALRIKQAKRGPTAP